MGQTAGDEGNVGEGAHRWGDGAHSWGANMSLIYPTIHQFHPEFDRINHADSMPKGEQSYSKGLLLEIQPEII